MPQGIPIAPQPTPNTLAEWWKQLVAFFGGLIIFGTVAFFVAKTFFVPKEDWLIHTQSITQKLNTIANKVDKIADKVDANTKSLSDATDAIHNIDLIMAAEGLSVDSPRARRIRRQRRHGSGR